MKICTLCGENKNENEFYRCPKVKSGKRSRCKTCEKSYGVFYIKNLTSFQKAERLRKEREFYKHNKERLIRRQLSLIKSNPVRRMKVAFRSWIRDVNKNSNRVFKKASDYYQYLGCDIPEFIRYIENLWDKKMSWENYGQGKNKWSLDHTRPVCSFDFSKEENWFKCFNYKNVTPMWNEQHNKKSLRDRKLLSKIKQLKIENLQKIIEKISSLVKDQNLVEIIREECQKEEEKEIENMVKVE